jgi:transposase
MVICFMLLYLNLLSSYSITSSMRDQKYFTQPTFEWQRRYEALRASFVERLPNRVVADRFGYSPGYVRLLRHQFTHGKIDFSEPHPEGKANRRRVSAQARQKIIAYRQHHLSAGQITELLSEEDIEISIRTVERVLAEEGFPKLPRRSRIKIGMTVKGAEIPERSKRISLADLNGQRFNCANAGIFLFAPLLCQLDINQVSVRLGCQAVRSSLPVAICCPCLL